MSGKRDGEASAGGIFVKPQTRTTDLGRIARAFGYSLNGLRLTFEKEAAFRQELAMIAVLVPLAIWLGETAATRALLIGSCLLVLIVELLNSAVEAVVDRFGGALHRLSGRAKDMGSAAVLISILNVTVVFGLVGWDRFVG